MSMDYEGACYIIFIHFLSLSSKNSPQHFVLQSCSSIGVRDQVGKNSINITIQLLNSLSWHSFKLEGTSITVVFLNLICTTLA